MLLDVDGIRHGYLIVDECKFEESRMEYDDYIFTPTFFNAHTHLGDAIAKEAKFGSIKELVAPPNGYKFRVFRKHSAEELRKVVIDEVEAAKRSGTSHFLDFREGGIEGVKIVEGIDGVLILGRPENLDEAKVMNVRGFGMSSTRDHDFEFLAELRKFARKSGLIFAIHAGEINCEDVDQALDLKPDLIVHMNMCEEGITKVIELQIPLVSCIRSNAFFGILNVESYKKMCDYEFWMLGTDNAMISTPSILDEMHFASYVLRRDDEIFSAAIRGFELFGVESGFVVFHRNLNFKNTNNIKATLVRRAGPADIERVVFPHS